MPSEPLRREMQDGAQRAPVLPGPGVGGSGGEHRNDTRGGPERMGVLMDTERLGGLLPCGELHAKTWGSGETAVSTGRGFWERRANARLWQACPAVWDAGGQCG